MVKVFQGEPAYPTARFGIVVSRWNSGITNKLLDEALEALKRVGVPEERIEVAWVPGSWEIPLAARRFVETRRVHAIVCLGSILKGETRHDVELAETVATVVASLCMESGIPITWGVLHCDTEQQAMERAGGTEIGVKGGNKGAEAALAAAEMVSLLDQMVEGG